MKVFWRFSARYLLPFKWWYLGGILFVILTQGLTVVIIEQTRVAIDALTASNDQAVIRAAVLLIAFGAILMVIRIASRLLIFTPGRMIEFNIRNDYYHKLLHLPRRFFANHESGDLVSRCSNDIGFVRGAYGYAMLQIANVLFTFVFGIAAMLRMDTRTTLYLAIPMIVSFALIQFSIFYMFKYWKKANLQVGQLSSLSLASFRGVSAVQGFHAEPAFMARFAEMNSEYLHTSTRITSVRSFMMPLVQLVGNLAVFVVLWVAGANVIRGEMTLGEITAFLGYISMVMPPLLSLGWMLNVFFRAVPAMERLDDILLARSDEKPRSPAPASDLPQSVDISLSKLNYRWQGPHSDEAFSLSDINLEIPSGKSVGIVGAVGAGKTTLVETLLRLNEPSKGKIKINGRDATDYDLAEYRRLFSFAPQKPFLFSTTLRNNLLVAVDGSADDEVLKAHLELASFDLDPKLFPLGLDTEVGEKGIMLSGGQRQRIALARALLKEARVFVLDDVLSAVDHDTERKIIHQITQFADNRSIIILSHRVSAVQWADEILVMEKGRVVDRGPHSALIEREGYYRDIYLSQTGGES